MKELIIFDCDGTILDTELVAIEFLPAYWSQHGVHISKEDFKDQFVGTGKDAQVKIEVEQKLGSDVYRASHVAFKEELAKTIKPVAGMEELIKSLDHPMCVASNSPQDYLEKMMKVTGFNQFFGTNVFSADQVPTPKPAPDLFLHALSVMKMSADNALVIEDSVSGINAAKAAGIPVVGITAASHFGDRMRAKVKDASPTWYCENASELEQLLKSL
jgi:HAD superfamily hydrolase (TIGR01509 family)